MATAETEAPAREFSENIKSLGESIVKLTVLEAKALGDYLEEVHGIKAAAAAVAAGPAAAAEAAPAAAEKTEFDVVLESCRRPEDRRHQGRPLGHRPRPEGGQGAGRRRPEADQAGRLQGGRREAEEGARGRRRHRQRQVIGPHTDGLGLDPRA